MRGMEIALSTYPSFHAKTIDEELVSILQSALEKLGLKIEQEKGSFPSHKRTTPENSGGTIDVPLPNASYLLTHEDLPASFFLSCVKMVTNGSNTTSDTSGNPKDSEKQAEPGSKKAGNKWTIALRKETYERLVFASKCSLSLGLAVLFGLLFDRGNGCWSGLTIAISFDTGKQAIFTLANARAQGTAMGSVYGILGYTLFQRFGKFRFVALLPWIIFTGFLRHSRMYGQGGGISAVIGALLILGRKNYGPPKEFAIERLNEAFIGLSCFILMELLFQPTRAAALAKYHLHTSLEVLKSCTEHIVLDSGQKVSLLREKQRHLKSQVFQLGKFISVAELEPDFWFLPFPVSCYQKLYKALTKIADLLHFMTCNIEFLSQVSQSSNVSWKEIQERINKDLELYTEAIASTTSSLSRGADSKGQLEEKKQHDLEEGNPHQTTCTAFCTEGKYAEKTLNSFLEHCKEVTEKFCELGGGKDDQRAKESLHLFAVGFCSCCLMEELAQVDKGSKELVQYEDP